MVSNKMYFKISNMSRTRHDFHLVLAFYEDRSCPGIYYSVKWDLFEINQLFMSINGSQDVFQLLTAGETLPSGWRPPDVLTLV